MLATPKVGIWEHSKCKLSSSVSEHDKKENVTWPIINTQN